MTYGDNLENIFGLAVTTAVAVKTIDYTDKVLSQRIPKKPKGKKSRKRNY